MLPKHARYQLRYTRIDLTYFTVYRKNVKLNLSNKKSTDSAYRCFNYLFLSALESLHSHTVVEDALSHSKACGSYLQKLIIGKELKTLLKA